MPRPELRTRLGLLDADVPARHLKMRVGRYTHHWNRNCVAVGLSQGFIEPLEATALLFVQRTAERLVAAMGPRPGRGRAAALQRRGQQELQGARDYIVSHYKTNSRTDTPYWRDNAANTALSAGLEELLRTWLARRPRSSTACAPARSATAIRRRRGTRCWPAWACSRPRPSCARPRRTSPVHDLGAIDALVAKAATLFPDHRATLAAQAAHGASAPAMAAAG